MERKVSVKVYGEIANPHASSLEKLPVCPGVGALLFLHEKLFSLLGIFKYLPGQGKQKGPEREALFVIHLEKQVIG